VTVTLKTGAADSVASLEGGLTSFVLMTVMFRIFSVSIDSTKTDTSQEAVDPIEVHAMVFPTFFLCVYFMPQSTSNVLTRISQIP